MPNIKSAKKRVKVIATKTLQNRMVKGNLRAALKACDNAIETNAVNKSDLVKAACKALDQSASKGIIHKNKAARKKSQIAAKLGTAKA